MSKKDKPKVEILPPVDERREIEPSDKGTYLPDLPLPKPGAIKSSLVTAIRYRLTAQAVRAYKETVSEIVETEYALGRLEEARLERQRSIRQLQDAHKIHEADQLFRDQQRDDAERERIKAEHKLAEAKADAEVAEFGRQQRVIKARKHHDRFLNKEHGDSTSGVDLDDLSEDEKQFVQDLEMDTRGHRYMEIAEAYINDFKAERRGKLSDKEEAYINNVREQAKKLIDDPDVLVPI